MARRLVFGVVLARCPTNNAGHTCATMNWALTFRELGWDVWITEHVKEEERSDFDAEGRSLQERFWAETVREFGFEGRECLLVNGASAQLAPMQAFAREADLFLNYSGQFHFLDLLPAGLPKAYLDLDPAFTQLWAETCDVNMNFEGHDAFLTIGMNANGASARYPKAGRDWLAVRPPVAARAWRDKLGVATPLPLPQADAPWTTVGHWYGYNDLPWQGRIYGGKRHSFLELETLPEKSGRRIAVATDLRPEWGEDTARFESKGWEFVESETACSSVEAYARFLRGSRGEIGIAKQGYLESRCGWVSDRSLCYLALGRPVALHDTGWQEILGLDAGMLPFSGVEGAARVLDRIERDYAAHAEAAWRLAETTFGPSETVAPMLVALGLEP